MSRVCFVIMPIGSGDAYKTHLNRYENLIAPAIERIKRNGERVLESVRADFISSTGSITRSVLQHIYASDVVVADLTDLNPNVFYELGVRHALRKGTILIALDGTKLPFDVGDLRVVFYQDRVGGEKDAIPKIQALLESRLKDDADEDSPIFLAIPELAENQSRDYAELRARIQGLYAETSELRSQLAVAEEVNLRLRESFGTFERTIKETIEHFAPRDREATASAIANAVREHQERPRRTIVPPVQEDPNQVFVLMPFNSQLSPVYDIIRMVGDKLDLRVFRADEMAAPGRITEQILDAIHRSAVIIADITSNNPNVLYEVGMAHTLGKPTVMLTQDVHNIPFDVASLRVIAYENTVLGASTLAKDLEKALVHLREQ